MKKLVIVSLLALAACSASQDYRPALLEQPRDAAKYERDRVACINESNAKYARAEDEARTSGSFLLGGLGVLGGAAQPSSDLDRTPMQHTQDCLRAKGYKLS